MTEPLRAHARLSPSGADRWMICPGSVRLTEHMHESSSVYADEGTAAHTIRELCLDLGLDAHHFVGMKQVINGNEFVWTDEDADHLQRGIDWVRQQPGTLVIEHRVDLGRWLPKQFGTMDVAIFSPNRLIVNDLKWGVGESVEAIQNKQLRIYALGMLDYAQKNGLLPADLPDDFEVLIVIDQPRSRPGRQKEWTITLKQLLDFGDEVRVAGERTYDPDAPLVASKKGCRWCQAKDRPGGCDTYSEWLLDHFGAKFEDLDDAADFGTPIRLPPASNLTPERRSAIIMNADIIKKWLVDLHDRTLAAAIAGEPTPGLKAVAGDKGDRKWRDPVAVETILVKAIAEDAFTKKLKSVKQVEDMIAPKKRKLGMPEVWKKLGEYVGQDDGKPVLVPVDHEKPALATVDQKFADADEDDLM